MIGPIRAGVAGRLREMVGSGTINLTRPPGDDGLFGPGSVAWRVHADFSAMMIGGVSALLLQMLHPGALAGVWDHSDFRRNRLGRLKRTAGFISVTTFGSTAAAGEAIARVRAIHAAVSGSLPDGTPYLADDPDLLAWVHVAEVDSFLRAYLRYRDPALAPAEQDRYLAENALVARRLGAVDVPETRAGVAAFYAQVRPALRFDHRTREIVAALTAPGEDPLAEPAARLVFEAGFDLLPDWAQILHGRRPEGLAAPAVRLAARGLSSMMRWSLRN